VSAIHPVPLVKHPFLNVVQSLSEVAVLLSVQLTSTQAVVAMAASILVHFLVNVSQVLLVPL